MSRLDFVWRLKENKTHNTSLFVIHYESQEDLQKLNTTFFSVKHYPAASYSNIADESCITNANLIRELW